MTAVLIKRKKAYKRKMPCAGRHMGRRQTYEDRGRDWNHSATNQERAELSEARRTKEDPPAGGLKGSMALITLGFGFSDFRIVRKYIVFV